ncbi:MAG: ATP-binding cassette domain-containing protein [Actinobacteria bacterium]|nr:ATP-binding cassette domain-containing protein [Actinomycetota bacterium]
MRDIAELIDALDAVVAGAPGFVDEPLVVEAEALALQLRRRTGYLGGTLVLAIVGGTGAGKSSLLNAIAGETVASVSDIRPHTHEPLAWMPESADSGLGALLDELDIVVRRRHDQFETLCIIDLPDFDSYAQAHREVVERLLPHVDAVAWLVDPVKYADPILHSEFLAPVSQHAAQFIFVMNKMDLLPGADHGTVIGDFQRLLRDDGFDDVRVIPVAASPIVGSPQGIVDLTDHLRERLTDKRVALNKLVHEVRDLVRRMGRDAGVWGGTGDAFEREWITTRDSVVDGLAGPPGSSQREDATCRLSDFIAALAGAAGPRGFEVRERMPVNVVAQVVNDIAATAATTSTEARRNHLDDTIGTPLRSWAYGRAVFGATVAFAGVSAYTVEDRLWR